MPQTEMPVLGPAEVAAAGFLKDYWVGGRVVRIRERGEEDRDSQVSTSQDAIGKGCRKKGKSGGKKGKERSQPSVLELHISGGNTPVDVIMVEAWGPSLCQKFKHVAAQGAFLKFTDCKILAHTPKTTPWTTSRLPWFLRATEETKVELACDDPTVPAHHPLTEIEDLAILPPKSLVCVAGRVIPPEPTVKLVGKDTPAEVGNAYIHFKCHTICVSAWRDRASKLMDLKVGSTCFIKAALTHPGTTPSGNKRLELRVGMLTDIGPCPDSLDVLVNEVTSKNPETATSLSSWDKRDPRDWSAENATWFSLSVVEAMYTSSHRRNIDMVCKVPSVFVQPSASSILYDACIKCKRSWRMGEGPSCTCASPEQGLLWKSALTLTDSTAQVTATCFNALEGLVHHFAGDDDEKKEPSYYQDAEHVEDLFTALAVVPFTVLLSFANNEYSENIEVIGQLFSPTFHPSMGVRHPMSKLVWIQTPSFGCPPCLLADTDFKPGVGMTVGPGGAVPSFRVLLIIVDTSPTPRKGDGSASFRITRRCACALRSDDDNRIHDLTQHGSQAVVLRLLALAKQTHIHAIVSWRSQKGLTLSSFDELPQEDVLKFKQFFKTEARLYRDMMSNSEEALQVAPDETPLRISSRASSNTQASPWSSRKRVAADALDD